jgi:hypothetical protein
MKNLITNVPIILFTIISQVISAEIALVGVELLPL